MVLAMSRPLLAQILITSLLPLPAMAMAQAAPAAMPAAARTRIGAHFDYSLAVVRTMMHRYPDAARLSWGYAQGLYLYGAYLTWRRTHGTPADNAPKANNAPGAARILPYIEAWANRHINAAGKIDRKITALDFVMPGQVVLALYRQTQRRRYRIAARHLRAAFNAWPTTSDGGYWHAYGRRHQLWLDGTFMMLPFLVRYGQMFHDRRWCDRTAVNQLLIYARHLNDPRTGLLFHAYDESGQQRWANPKTHHSSQFWARSIGWYAMALLITLHHLPAHYPRRARLLALARQLARAFTHYQDRKTGLWHQVVNRSDLPQNWLETSASCMYAYFLAAAALRGYIARRYRRVALRAYRGILGRMIPGHDGRIHIPDICVGTNVGDLQFYLHRPRKTDDFHGIGAFLIMNEYMQRHKKFLRLQ